MLSTSISKNRFKTEYNNFLNKWNISCVLNLILISIWIFNDDINQFNNILFNIALVIYIISLIYSIAGIYIYYSIKNKYIKNLKKSNQIRLNKYISKNYDSKYFQMYSLYILTLFIIFIISNYNNIDWTYFQFYFLISFFS